MPLGKQNDGVEQGDDESRDEQCLIPVISEINSDAKEVIYCKIHDTNRHDMEADNHQCSDG